jgi:hypothetical protein
MSWIDSRHWTISTCPHFQNVSQQFNIVRYHHNFICGMLNFCSIVVAILKMVTGRNFSKSGINSGHHYLPTYQIVMISVNVEFLRYCLNWFPTLNNFYRTPFSKWPPQYHTNSTLPDFNAISHVGRLWCPELILDIEQFLLFAIFKMATATGRNCSMSGIN